MQVSDIDYVSYSENGHISPARVRDVVNGDIAELQRSTGISKDGLTRKERVTSAKTQRRLRQFIEIIELARQYQGSGQLAFAWFRTAQLAGFDNRTPEELFRDDHADWVRLHLLRKLEGGYA